MKNPVTSIIVPCYNYAHLLGETLESVAAQKLTDWECIIVNDGSTDNTVEIAQQFVARDPRFRLIFQINSGPSQARNTGIAQSRGQFLQFLDADDLIEPHKLRLQSEFLQSRADIDMVIARSGFFFSDTSGQIEELVPDAGHHFLQEEIGGLEAVLWLLQSNLCVINAPLIRREVGEKVGWFNPNLRYNEDWDFWMRVANVGAHFAAITQGEQDRALVRLHQGSLSSSALKMRLALLDLRKQWNQDGFFAPEFDEIARAENRRIWLQEEWAVAKIQACQRQVGEGWRRTIRLAKSSRNPKHWAMLLVYPFYSQPRLRALMRWSKSV